MRNRGPRSLAAIAFVGLALGVSSPLMAEDTAIDEPPVAAPTESAAEAVAASDVATAAAAAAAPATVTEVLDTVTVTARMPTLSDQISQRVEDASQLLRHVPLHFNYTKRFWRETLRGRPVTFAAWSELNKSWHIVELEIPFPPPRLRFGRPLSVRVVTPGYAAVHVRGVGAERLMFDIYRDGERLKVYGRKYPMIEAADVKKLGVRNAVAVAEITDYLPMLDDAAPLFVSQGQALLRSTAENALRELRDSQVASFAYPGKLLGDTVLPETLMSLAVIEQTDDAEFNRAPADALDKTVGHYGLMQAQAFTYSVSRAKAAGPMQFTDKRGRGTYTMVVRRCADAKLERDFNAGARDLQNAMKAAACLLDMNLAALPREVQSEYSANPAPLSIFGVAAYNGGGRNAARLLRAVRSLRGTLAELRIPAASDFDTLAARCPCLWLDRSGTTTGMRIPAYNRENMGYVDKYLRFMSMVRATDIGAVQ